MRLTAQQISFFKQFGYLAMSKLFSAAEIAVITEDFEYSIQTFGGGDSHNHERRTMFGGPIEHVPRFCSLIDDPRILGLAGSLLGEDFNYGGGDGNYYSGDTGWHPDGHWGQLFSAKIAFYLDPVTRDSGCLRVLPGSHHPENSARLSANNPSQSLEQLGILPRDYPGNVPLETVPGDVVMFNHDTWHASFGGGNRRRMFTLNLTRHCTTPADLETFRSYFKVHSAGGYRLNIGGTFFEPMLATASASRMRHLQQPIAIHDELFPEFAMRLPHEQQVAAMSEVIKKMQLAPA